MAQILKKDDLIDALSKKSGFYKRNMKVIVEAFSELILEVMRSATLEEDSELYLMDGVVIGGHRVPAREAKDPRTGETIISPEKVIPYAKFKQSVRYKLFAKPKSYKKKKKV